MSRHAASKSPRRALLRAGLTLTAAGAALASGGAAQAAPAPDLAQSAGVTHLLDELDAAAPAQVATTALGHAAAGAPTGVVTNALESATAGGIAPLKDLRLNPLAGTGVDPLDNVVGTQIADFKPLSTGLLTNPLTEGAAPKDLPIVGDVVAVLPG